MAHSPEIRIRDYIFLPSQPSFYALQTISFNRYLVHALLFALMDRLERPRRRSSLIAPPRVTHLNSVVRSFNDLPHSEILCPDVVNEWWIVLQASSSESWSDFQMFMILPYTWFFLDFRMADCLDDQVWHTWGPCSPEKQIEAVVSVLLEFFCDNVKYAEEGEEYPPGAPWRLRFNETHLTREIEHMLSTFGVRKDIEVEVLSDEQTAYANEKHTEYRTLQRKMDSRVAMVRGAKLRKPAILHCSFCFQNESELSGQLGQCPSCKNCYCSPSCITSDFYDHRRYCRLASQLPVKSPALPRPDLSGMSLFEEDEYLRSLPVACRSSYRAHPPRSSFREFDSAVEAPFGDSDKFFIDSIGNINLSAEQDSESSGRLCSRCGKVSPREPKFRPPVVCQGCHLETYCSQKCEEADQEDHKSNCQSIFMFVLKIIRNKAKQPTTSASQPPNTLCGQRGNRDNENPLRNERTIADSTISGSTFGLRASLDKSIRARKEHLTSTSCAREPACCHCNKDGSSSSNSLSLCSKCRRVWYCSRACQKVDWDKHKLVCSDATIKYQPTMSAVPSGNGASSPSGIQKEAVDQNMPPSKTKVFRKRGKVRTATVDAALVHGCLELMQHGFLVTENDENIARCYSLLLNPGSLSTRHFVAYGDPAESLVEGNGAASHDREIGIDSENVSASVNTEHVDFMPASNEGDVIQKENSNSRGKTSVFKEVFVNQDDGLGGIENSPSTNKGVHVEVVPLRFVQKSALKKSLLHLKEIGVADERATMSSKSGRPGIDFYFYYDAHKNPEAVELAESLNVALPSLPPDKKHSEQDIWTALVILRRLITTGNDIPSNLYLVFGPKWFPDKVYKQQRLHALMNPPVGSPSFALTERLDDTNLPWAPRPANEQEIRMIRDVRQMQLAIVKDLDARTHQEGIDREKVLESYEAGVILAGYANKSSDMDLIFDTAAHALDLEVYNY